MSGINWSQGGASMNVKFSEDIVPLTDMKVNPGKVVKRTNESHRPVLLTSRGRGVAVVQSLDDFEQAEEEKAFMRAIVEGLNDLDNKREISIDAAKARLGLK
jgi:prevent-host-death family protein